GSYGSLVIAADGSWDYSADNSQSVIQNLGISETLTDSFTVTTADSTTHVISITLNGANDAPTVEQGLSDQSATEEVAFSYQIPADAFADKDGDSLTLTATLNNGNPLPSWLNFDAVTRTFSGTPDDNDTGDIIVKVTADDGSQQVSSQFTLSTAATNDPPELAQQPLINNLVTALNFNTGAGLSAQDATGNGHSATLNGSATWVVDRHGSGSAFNMDGSDGYGEISGINTGGSMTVATWVRFESFDQSSSRVIDFGNGQASDNIVLYHKGNTGTLSFDIYGNSDTPHTTLEVTDFFVLNTWVHVTATIASDGTVRVYRNGELAGQVSGTAPTEMVRSGNYIGKSHWSGDGYFDGSLDDFVLVSETLDAAEVSALYLAGSVDNVLADGFHVPENSVSGTVVGSVSGTDVDNSSLTYSLTDDASGYFEIDSNTGEITVSSTAVLNTEAQATYDITVQVSDGLLTDSRTYTIHVSNVAEAPTVNAPVVASGTDESGTFQVDLLKGASVEDAEATLSADNLTRTGGNDTGITNSGNTLSIDADAYAYLPDGHTETITYSYDVLSSTGIRTTQTVTITLTGTNEAAVISGVDTGTLTEDASDPLTTSGTLNVSDQDTGESSFKIATVSGSYGSLQINALGAWSYSANNSHSAIQGLGAGDTLTDTLTVQARDSTTHSVVITIQGTNDNPVIGGVASGSVTEDDGATLTISDHLTITDADSGEDQFTAETVVGTYGSLIIDTNGGWTYTADNTQSIIQSLPAGSSLTDTLTVSTADGTTHSIVIVINGVNDAAVFSGDDTAAVTEDTTVDGSGHLTASGILNITDIDTGESSLTAETVIGVYGALAIDAVGNWSYEVDNSQSAIQSLGDGDSLVDTLTVTSDDGTTHTVAITINGTNDDPVISGDTTASITEDDQTPTLTASGSLSASDTDTDESGFINEDLTGSYGTLSIEVNGDWTYSASNSQSSIQGLGTGDTLADSFTVRSIDGTTETVTITISGINDAPVVSTVDLGDSDEDQSFVITSSALLANAFDAEGDTLSVTSVTLDNSAQGSFVDNGDSTWTFSPAQNFNGQGVGFTFTVSDGTSGNEVTASATLDVTAINDAPDLTDDTSSGQATVGGPEISGASSVLANDSDVDNDPLTVVNVNGQSIAESGTTTIDGRHGSLAIASDGTWSYTPDTNLIAYWSFDEISGNTATDTATGDADDNNGILLGDARFTSGGLRGNAVSFDGTGDLVAIGDSTELNTYTGTQSQRTISLAFKVDSTNSLTGRQILYEEGGNANGYNLYIDAGALYVGAWSESNSWSGEWLSFDLSATDMTQWHRVSLVLDADNNSLKAYLNDVEFGSANGSAMATHGDEASF
ncbi:MAG: VCBS domain-containing protein, partial [Endozoicomonas sp.]